MKPVIVNLFEKVQSIPYKVCKFDETALNENISCGDCRHKSYILKNLLEKEGFEVHLVKVIFDWRDLPLPESMIKILKKSGTVWPHSIIEVKVGGKWVKVDCTWDLKLKELGFPVTENWNGSSDTKQVTKRNLEFYKPEVYEAKHKILIDKTEAYEFAEKLNQFLILSRK
ncbi:MAG: hypothetical protein KGH55_01260 [Nanoarchaeota archaeon]|nr:hypothetical protein [Nanoarchaeota archaeon]